MPQSRTVFAVSLQVHPELLKTIFPHLHQEVKGYYFSFSQVLRGEKTDTANRAKKARIFWR
jgi:hypothetical protein